MGYPGYYGEPVEMSWIFPPHIVSRVREDYFADELCPDSMTANMSNLLDYNVHSAKGGRTGRHLVGRRRESTTNAR